ncbi:outer membrane protein TolC [Desulfobotulus alkaliphilus]|uniref:Outer membrane protein TolC n=2 Tax=Desulfobotulus alkaliphilus TaxID=622671 RepID=A0A562S9U6_9BACT|nr:outer membrane protein TolC [Desulfobotulus alkaliphilus]
MMNSGQKTYGYKTGLMLTFLLLFFIPTGAKALQFEQAFSRMMEENQRLAAARSGIEQKEAEQKAARGLYYPQLQISASWTHMNAPLEVELGALNTRAGQLIHTLHPGPHPPDISAITGSLPQHYELQEQSFLKSDLTLSWPVYTGGKITAANRAADVQLELARTSKEALSHQMFSELVRFYYGVRLADAVVQVRREVVQGMEKHLHQAIRLEETGMIALAERLHAQVAVEEARREYKKALRDAKIARTALKSLIACEDDVKPRSPLFFYRNIPDMAVFMEKARKNNPLLLQLHQQEALASAGMQKEKSAYKPDVFLFGTRALITDDLTVLEPEWAAGAGIRFTLFDGFSRSGRVEAAHSVKNQISQLRSQAIRDMETLVESRYQRLMQAIEQIDTLAVSRTFVREYLRVRTRAFEEGFATSLDVVDAELALSKVQITHLQALFDFDLALARLLETTGSISDFEYYRTNAEKEAELP